MADITGNKGSLEGQPEENTTAQDSPTPNEDKEMHRSAEKSAERASQTIRRYDADHDIFTK